MKATDLMIGDWVTGKKWREKPFKLIRIRDNGKYFYGITADGSQVGPFFLEELEPIPLTPEILEKNGFVLKSDGWLWCKEEGINEQNYIFIQFRKGCDEIRLVELNFVNKVLAKYEQIHYVHELQHALKLCGVEKEIVL